MSVAQEKKSIAWQDPELQQCVLGEYPADWLRAAMKKDMGLMRDFSVAGEIPSPSVADKELHGALDTTWANKCKGLEENTFCSRMLPIAGRLGQALRFNTCLNHSEAYASTSR